MPYNAKYNKYKENYSRENYDRIQLVTAKGTRKRLKAEAEKRGISVNALLNEIIDRIIPADPPEPSEQFPENTEPEPRQLPED